MSGSTGVVLIPAAGRGQRMGSETPKQYLPVNGRPLLARTIEAIHRCDRVHGIVVAIHPDDQDRYDSIAAAIGPKLRGSVFGGHERTDSVYEALKALQDEDDIILVHDAVRPWVRPDLVANVIDATDRHGAAIAALPVTDTVKQVADGVIVATPDRRQLWNAQTPQGFHRELLISAFAQRDPAQPATDESVLVERAGHQVHIVEGDVANVKVTTPRDLPSPETLPTRIGQGYDVHAFDEGSPLILGGVPIESPRGLMGHSDADVLTHAVIDALLGAVNLGDVGQLFPDTDAAYAGISSLVLLEQVRNRLQSMGAQIINIDTVIIAQAPKLAPYAQQIAASLAATLQLDVSRVSIKATTTERLGFIGREEGMAAQAVALVSLGGAVDA
ncbi:MAG TPA: 2-C-methyl-D-erythritol 4-phosphate cytidylyltransferase [Candidatus Latescibacteria bacterium]|nr:2-C-methyl-D-erythritol 4-phosphate cytidylyltransferase [Candidatus Latescibacterota bacterium]MDP7635261.1 2-C-methyl-D-erythritol 4-phosphate cytidylyltransferase [Candidatus Latescibacterota bacterium]HJN29811.1 2-C-methyl-D-erythritol 4-phosphate cytidylyltransferase [Candidatus Latescibacterota bacterium]